MSYKYSKSAHLIFIYFLKILYIKFESVHKKLQKKHSDNLDECCRCEQIINK